MGRRHGVQAGFFSAARQALAGLASRAEGLLGLEAAEPLIDQDQGPRHSGRASSRTTAAMALRMPATVKAGKAIHLMRIPPVLQSTAQSTRRTKA